MYPVTVSHVSNANTRRERVEALANRWRRSVARLAASRRRTEVLDVVGNARTEDEATEAVSDLLDVDGELAGEVIEMPVKAFAQENVATLEQQTEHLEQRLAALRSEG